MNAEVLTPEKTVTISDEMVKAFLTLASLTNTFGMSETIAKAAHCEYEILMNNLIEEYDKKL